MLPGERPSIHETGIIMPTTTKDILSFHQYAVLRIENGGAVLDLDDLLEEWKNLKADPQQMEQDALAVKAALQDIANGDVGLAPSVVLAEIRAKYNLGGQ